MLLYSVLVVYVIYSDKTMLYISEKIILVIIAILEKLKQHRIKEENLKI